MIIIQWLIGFFKILIALGLGVAALETYLVQSKLPRVYIFEEKKGDYLVNLKRFSSNVEDGKNFYIHNPFRKLYLKKAQKVWGIYGYTFRFKNIQIMESKVGIIRTLKMGLEKPKGK